LGNERVSSIQHDHRDLIAWLEPGQRPALEAVYVPGNEGESGEMVFWSAVAPGGSALPSALLALAGAGDADEQPSLEELGFFSRQLPLILPRPKTPTGRKPRTPYGRLPVHGRAVDCWRLLQLLGPLALDPGQTTRFGPLWAGSSLQAYALAAKLALELAVGQRFVPSLRSLRRGREQRGTWAADLGRPRDRQRFQRLMEQFPPPAYCLSASSRNLEVWAPHSLLRRFLDDCIDALVRTAAAQNRGTVGMGSEQLPEAGPDSWEAGWLQSLTGANSRFAAAAEPQWRHLPAELEQWNAAGRGERGDLLRLGLRLDPPGDDPEAEAGVSRAGYTQGRWQMRFLVQAPDDPSLIVPVERIWHHPQQDIQLWGRVFPRAQEQVLAALGRAAAVFTPLSDALAEAAPTTVELSTEQVADFLSGSFHILREMGVEIVLPVELTSERSHLQAKLVVDDDKDWESTGLFGETLFQSYRWEAAIGDQEVSAAEFRAIADMKSSLIRWRGRWLRVDPDQVASMDTFLRRRSQQPPSGADVLGTALGGDALAQDLQVDVDVELQGALARLFELLRSGGFEPLPAPDGFQGELRPYQERGVGWLAGLSRVGLGGCLADDMGLGKTIQVIAWLMYQFDGHHAPAAAAEEEAEGQRAEAVLIVCPTSLLGNWRQELSRFAPDLPAYVHYGPQRARSLQTLMPQLDGPTVVLTSYHTARLDQALLQAVGWKAVVIDEAQNIKNPHSKQAQAIHRLRAPKRLALSGTPVENRLAELWSILQFTTPGLLGSFDAFQEKMARPIERFRDQRSIQRLQGLVKPFVLRRVKTDPTIIHDLPEKEERVSHCLLTREQASLYQAKVDETLAALPDLHGFARAAKILSSLTALKQICNHPAQYLKERGPVNRRSGKLERLESIVERAAANGESTLVFTQYAAMGRLLQDHLQNLLDLDVFFLHGGCSQAQRQDMVRRFQEADGPPRVFLLSLKAGGTGLTLTKASCVVHYDRWWNPAVEDQATDRAYRIGQTKQVHVHKLVCSGTLEERIDQVLLSKRDLAAQALGSAGDQWMTEMSDQELQQLLSLDSAALVSEEEGEEA